MQSFTLLDGSPPTETDSDATATDVYVNANFSPIPTVDVSIRLGWDELDLSDDRFVKGRGLSGPTPGVGVTWLLLPGTTLRAAASRTIKRPYAANQTLRPTQLTGFNQIYDEFDGTRADQINIAAEHAFGEEFAVGISATRRRLARELFLSEGADRAHLTDVEDDRVVAYAYWTPTDRLAIALQPMVERYRAREREVSDDPVRVRTYTVPLTAAWFDPAGWYAFANMTLLQQDVDTFERGEPERLDDLGVLMNVGVGYRLPARRGTVGLRLDNLFDRRLSFQDESLRTDADLNPRFVPARTLLLTATINF